MDAGEQDVRGVEGRVRDHYGGDDLAGRVEEALRRVGHDGPTLEVGDLAGLDQLHAGGRAATEHLLDALDLSPATRLLDVGCGIGGPARLAASRHGCPVTGIDLSADFVALARDLTARVGLADRVAVEVGSATALPWGDASFDRAMLNHVGMNIADKAAVFAEARRVLAPGGLFGVYEQMRIGDGELMFPLPWADDAGASFVVGHDDYLHLLGGAGFVVERDEDRTAAVAGPPVDGVLTPADLFGPGFAERIGNNIHATLAGTLGAVLVVARAA